MQWSHALVQSVLSDTDHPCERSRAARSFAERWRAYTECHAMLIAAARSGHPRPNPLPFAPLVGRDCGLAALYIQGLDAEPSFLLLVSPHFCKDFFWALTLIQN